MTVPSTTAGNCLVVCVFLYDAAGGSARTVSGITIGGSADNFGSSASVAAGSSSANTGRAEIWCDPDCAGGQTSLVVTLSGALGGSLIGFCVQYYEISGLALSSVADQTAGNAGASSASWTSTATGSTSQASEIAIGMTGNFGGSTVTITGPGSPWTNETQLNAGMDAALLSGYDILSSTGTATYSGSLSTSEPYAAAVVTLKGASTPQTVSLTTPNLALAAPLVTPEAGAAVGLTTPNLALAAPLVTPETTGPQTVNLTTPNLALAAPLVTPAAKSAGVAGLLLAWPP